LVTAFASIDGRGIQWSADSVPAFTMDFIANLGKLLEDEG
jgi:hypothetical protein